jgi:hypothetical protein
MTTLEVLRAARAKIADRKNWTRGYFARDTKGREVACSDAEACRFCALGALRAVGGSGLIDPLAHEELQRASKALGFGSLVAIANDTPMTKGGAGHRGILAAYDRAIEKLEAAA